MKRYPAFDPPEYVSFRPEPEVMAGYRATIDRDPPGRALHTGAPERGVIPPNSFMGCLVPVFAGIGIAIRQRGERRVALTYVGDGASRTSAFHEGFNFASVQRVPMVVVLQHNQVALG